MPRKGNTYQLPASPKTVHTGFFDAALPPVLTIESGDTVTLSSMMLMEGRLRRQMTVEDLMALREEYAQRRLQGYTLTGPIFIRGADPGDVLEVRIKKLVPAAWGVNYHLPGSAAMGGLPEDFPAGHFRSFRLDRRNKKSSFSPKVVIPLRPFFGVMGVAPRPGEKRPAALPDYFGGNMDNKELVAGTTLYLPVHAPGALFSVGDAHAAQGDGEVNVTAIETAMEEAVLQFWARHDLKLARPMAETPTHWITMGFHEDLDEAVKMALREAIRFLTAYKGLNPDEAYALASLAVDFRVTQIVDIHKGIHAMIPKAIFKK